MTFFFCFFLTKKKKKRGGEVCGYMSHLLWQKGLKYKVSTFNYCRRRWWPFYLFWNFVKTTTFIKTHQSFRMLDSCLSHGTLEELAEISEIWAAFPLGFLPLKELFPIFLFPHLKIKIKNKRQQWPTQQERLSGSCIGLKKGWRGVISWIVTVYICIKSSM